MASLIDFVDRLRILQDLPTRGVVALSGTEVNDDENCLLARALLCRVGTVVGKCTTLDPDWPWAMRFSDRLLTRRVGIIMGLEWLPTPRAVRLPDAVADLGVAQHNGWVEADDLGLLSGWWVPADDQDGATGKWSYLTPYQDDLLPGGDWKLSPPSWPRPRV